MNPGSRPTPHVSPLPFLDAHNHLQDERFGGRQENLLAEAVAAGVGTMVVNGSCESDWPAVAALAERHAEVIPAFGWHPWYLGERSAQWLPALRHWLTTVPGSVIGEIGLDRWMIDQPERWRRYRDETAPDPTEPPGLAEQEEVFVGQLRLAAELERPVSLHCLQAFGRLLELLKAGPLPRPGFLLHSYGGPAEMVPVFAKLGGYFSFPGYFLQERKARQRDVFRHVPAERLLVETDAPDQLPPDAFQRHPLKSPGGRPLNHPANLAAIYSGLATFLAIPVEELSDQVAQNFQRLFGLSFAPRKTPGPGE